jgi:hypothetical protein
MNASFMMSVIISYKSLQVIKSSHRRGSRKTDVDTDESDSDPDQLTSSRTESSNQLDAGKVKHSE